MFPNSPFASPTSSFNHPVPLVGTDPDADPLVCVTFNKSYIPYIVGALQQLLLQSTWSTNDLNAIDLQQMRVFDLIYLFSVAQPCVTPTVHSGIGGDFMPLIRQNPANSCILEGSFDNITWVTIMDVSKCQNFGTNPGAGTPQPVPGGGSVKNCYALDANSILSIGIPVSTGDVITLDISGSGWDGVEVDFGPLYRCPDGKQYLAGICTGFQRTDGSDPVPSAYHMSTVISIAGTFYSIMPNVPFTVPSGVSNVTPFIQVNDSSLANNQGSYQVCITVVNNAVTSWCMEFNFELGTFGWLSNAAGAGALWNAGEGWSNDPSQNSGQDTQIYISFPSTEITSISFDYAWDGTCPGGSSIMSIYKDIYVIPYIMSSAISNPSGTLSWAGDLNFTAIYVGGNMAGGGCVAGGHNLIIKSCTIRGKGINPFGTSNC